METVAAAVHLYVVHVLALGFNDPSGARRYLHDASQSASQLTPLQKRMIEQDLDPLAGSAAASANLDAANLVDETRSQKADAGERDAANPTDATAAAAAASGGSGGEAPGAKATTAACRTTQGEAAAAATEKATPSGGAGDAAVSTPWYRQAAASLTAMVGASGRQEEGETSRDLSLTPQQVTALSQVTALKSPHHHHPPEACGNPKPKRSVATGPSHSRLVGEGRAACTGAGFPNGRFH